MILSTLCDRVGRWFRRSAGRAPERLVRPLFEEDEPGPRPPLSVSRTIPRCGDESSIGQPYRTGGDAGTRRSARPVARATAATPGTQEASSQRSSLRLKTGPTVWITRAASSLPAVVATAAWPVRRPLAVARGTELAALLRQDRPPRRWMAPSTPPPPSREEFAAFVLHALPGDVALGTNSIVVMTGAGTALAALCPHAVHTRARRSGRGADEHRRVRGAVREQGQLGTQHQLEAGRMTAHCRRPRSWRCARRVRAGQPWRGRGRGPGNRARTAPAGAPSCP